MKRWIILWVSAVVLSFGLMQSQAQAQENSVQLSGILEIREDQIFIGETKISLGASANALQNTMADFDYNKNKQIESVWDEMKGMTRRHVNVQAWEINGVFEVYVIEGQVYENPALKGKTF